MITKISEPFKFSFCGNKNELALECSGFKSEGTKAKAIMADYARNFIAGAHFDFVLDGVSFEFVLSASPKQGAYPYQVAATPEALVTAIGITPGIGDLVNVVKSVDSSRTVLTFTYKSNGPHTMEFYSIHEADDSEESGRYNLAYNTDQWVAGEADTDAEGYGVTAIVEVATNDCGTIKSYVTEPIYFEPDGDDRVRMQLDVLNSYKVRPDLPGMDETFGVKLCTNAMMRYLVKYNESFVVDGKRREFPRMSTGYKYAFNGEEVAYFAALNLPDWNDTDTGDQFSYNEEYTPRMIGSDNNKVCRIGEDQPEYLYMWYYQADLAMNANVDIKVLVTYADQEDEKVETTIKNGNLYRIACGPKAVGMASHKDSYWYRIEVYNPETEAVIWTRTYILRPSYANQRYMLLQDKYGMLRSVEAYNLTKEVVMEGEGMTRNGEHSVHRTNAYELWKATTAAMTSDECKLFATSVKNDFHYVWTGAGWKRMSLEPITLTSLSDSEDLVQMELTYRLATDQTENAATNPDEAQQGSNMLETEEGEEAVTTENDFALEMGPVGLDDLQGVSPYVLAELQREEATTNNLLID